MDIKVKRLHPLARLPVYATEGSACFDLHACLDKEDSRIYRGHPKTIPTGLAFEIPEGFVMLAFSRSGHAFNHSTRLGNCVGIIDSDFRGEVKINLIRDTSDLDMLLIRHGDRIAQAMIVPFPRISFLDSENLSETERGADGFGSTGK